MNQIKNEILSKKEPAIINMVTIVLEKNFKRAACDSEKLEVIPKGIINDFFLSYERVGIDIVDFMGVSGLVNIGYSQSQTTHIKNLNIKMNDYGLIETYEQSETLANILSSFAPEHSPFFPIEIWRKNNVLPLPTQ